MKSFQALPRKKTLYDRKVVPKVGVGTLPGVTRQRRGSRDDFQKSRNILKQLEIAYFSHAAVASHWHHYFRGRGLKCLETRDGTL